MRSALLAGAAFAASVAANNAGCFTEGGENWYCKLVQKISYTGIGSKAGQYQKITNMANGACDKSAYDYSGSMSPMDEDVCQSQSASLCTLLTTRSRSRGTSEAP